MVILNEDSMAVPAPKKTPKLHKKPKRKPLRKSLKPKLRPDGIDVSPNAEAGDQAHVRQGDVRDNSERGQTY